MPRERRGPRRPAGRCRRTRGDRGRRRSRRRRCPAGSRAPGRARRGRGRSSRSGGRRTTPGRFAPMRRGTYSIVAQDPRTGELGVAVQSHWFGVGPIVPWARARASARSPRSRSPSRRTARGCSTALAAGERPRDALDRRAGRRPAGAPTARSRSSTRAARDGRPHRGALHRVRGRRARRGLQRAGEHDGLARRLARDGPGVRGGGRPARAAAARGARTPPRRTAATCAGASRRRCSSSRRRGSRGARASTCGSRTTPSRSPSSTGCSTSTTPTSWPNAGDELTGEGRHDEAGDAYARAERAGARQPRAALLGGPRGGPGGGHAAGAGARARGDRAAPAWRELLGRLEPDVAPSAAAVREALEGGLTERRRARSERWLQMQSPVLL